MSLQQLDSVITQFSAMRAAWNESVAFERMRSDLDDFYTRFAGAADTRTQAVSAAGVPAEWVECVGHAPAKGAILYLHGGGFSVGSIAGARPFASRLAAASHARVLVVGYRLAPEAVFPAQIEDAITCYRWLIGHGHQASEIAIGGDSAGGGLALALLGALIAQGMSVPSCCFLLTPWVDMRCLGESYRTNRDTDPVASLEMAQMMAATYLGESGRADDPRATPILSSFEGFPPLLIQAAGRDVFLDDARAVHDRALAAHVPSAFDEWPQMIHQWQLYAAQLDEGQSAIGRLAVFLARHLTRA